MYNRAKLSGALRSLWSRLLLIAGMASASCASSCNAADGNSTQTVERPFLTIRLVDEAGKPVGDADVGLYHYFLNSHWILEHHAKSDAEGFVRFGGPKPEVHPLRVYARHAARKLVAIWVSHEEAKTIGKLTMFPECRVTCSIVCRELQNRGRNLSGYVRMVYSHGAAVVENSVAPTNQFEAFLPPGKFRLLTYADATHFVWTPLDIPGNVRNLDLGEIDHAPTQLALLEGKVAPELHDIVAWKNGPAVSLASLRGKVVLLEFWGFWCGPCVRESIPQLIRLREQFPRKDLAIVGVHVDNGDGVTSAKELDHRLARYSSLWHGKDISFPVALTAEQRIEFRSDVSTKARNSLCATYGVRRFPTTILIDRRGRVVREVDITSDLGVRVLRAAVDAL
jgi:thiol-disulfide isomerase/thioredoxin